VREGDVPLKPGEGSVEGRPHPHAPGQSNAKAMDSPLSFTSAHTGRVRLAAWRRCASCGVRTSSMIANLPIAPLAP